MSEIENAIKSGDVLVDELRGVPARPSTAPTMGRLQKVSYTHDAMIDLIIAQPHLDQNHLAAHFGYTPSWISNVFASDAFQVRMAARREEVVDPAMKASIEERFRALVIQSLDVLQKKLSQSVVSDAVALRAAELGAKALGIGGHKPQTADPAVDRLEKLAERLVILNGGIRARVLDAEEVKVIESKPLGSLV